MNTEILQNKLMEMFIMKDFMARNKYLPLNPHRQAFINYQNDPEMQRRINGIVGDVLEAVEKYVGLHTEEN